MPLIGRALCLECLEQAQRDRNDQTKLKHRNVVEPVIGYMKSNDGLAGNFL
ncbi:MAG: hypothetical protein Q7T62_02930 [Undibacterium sp.]|nr:hypothetical protein [Undibacterium sp.]